MKDLEPDTGGMDPAEDIIAGADAIAAYLGLTRRQVYAHVERKNLPCFRIGATICLRKTTMLEWIGQQEIRATEAAKETLPAPSTDLSLGGRAGAFGGRRGKRGR